MELTAQELFAIIGEKEVTIIILRTEIEALKQQLARAMKA